MINSQLAKLLSNSTLTEEDIYNVSVIFGSLSDEKKNNILGNWEFYLEKLEFERKKLNEEYSISISNALSQANNLLDEAITKFNTKKDQKNETKRITREELNSTIFYSKI